MGQPAEELLPITERPVNLETPLAALLRDVTPASLFYVRNHFDVPPADATSWAVSVDGALTKPRDFALAEIQSMPAKTIVMALECAGHSRKFLSPVPDGTPWGVGAVSVGRFTGTPLANVLRAAGLGDSAEEILFVGADQGKTAPGSVEPFARSLPVEVALHSDTILAWELNGSPLTPNHGFPLRLVVPRWYGMASVKWLQQILALTEPFEGYFQTCEYVYREEGGALDGAPVTRMLVKSLIAQPVAGARVERGTIEIAGIAWTGRGTIETVEVSVDGGSCWEAAEVEPAPFAYQASRWRFRWVPSAAGAHTLLARATDSEGNAQPLDYRRDRLGYGNNGAHSVEVFVE